MERTGPLPLYSEAKKIKLLTLHTHGSLKVSSRVYSSIVVSSVTMLIMKVLLDWFSDDLFNFRLSNTLQNAKWSAKWTHFFIPATLFRVICCKFCELKVLRGWTGWSSSDLTSDVGVDSCTVFRKHFIHISMNAQWLTLGVIALKNNTLIFRKNCKKWEICPLDQFIWVIVPKRLLVCCICCRVTALLSQNFIALG